MLDTIATSSGAPAAFVNLVDELHFAGVGTGSIELAASTHAGDVAETRRLQ